MTIVCPECGVELPAPLDAINKAIVDKHVAFHENLRDDFKALWSEIQHIERTIGVDDY